MVDAAGERTCAAVILCYSFTILIVLLLMMLNPHVLPPGCPLGTGRRCMCGSRNVGPLRIAVAPVGVSLLLPKARGSRLVLGVFYVETSG